jgi:hypothetical protein
MSPAPTSTDIASSLRTRIDRLREELASFQALNDELRRLEAALRELEPEGAQAMDSTAQDR